MCIHVCVVLLYYNIGSFSSGVLLRLDGVGKWTVLSGCDCTMFLSAVGGKWYGVDVNNEDIADNFDAFVWEPALVKKNALTAAAEAACLILSVDETIRNPKSNAEPPAALPGRGRGMPM